MSPSLRRKEQHPRKLSWIDSRVPLFPLNERIGHFPRTYFSRSDQRIDDLREKLVVDRKRLTGIGEVVGVHSIGRSRFD